MAWVKYMAEVARARRTGLSSWFWAGAILAASLIFRLGLSPWLEGVPFVTFYPAIAASALLYGWRQGLLVLVLSSLAAWYFFLLPYNSFAPAGLDTLLQMISFLLVGGFFLVLVEGLVRAVEQFDTAARIRKDLFNELQHRVANNLQIVAMTLEKAKRRVEDQAALAAIDVALERIHSMARLHRRLYDSAAYAKGLEPILRDLLEDTFSGLDVDVRLDIRPHDLSVGEMTAIVLMVNEAAINAAKHVYRLQKGRLFEVSLTEDRKGVFQLTIRDDGPGIAQGLTEQPKVTRFGLDVMRSLARQLGSSLQLSNGQGTKLSVEFSRADRAF